MSTLRPKRVRTKRPRPSPFPEVISYLPSNASTASSTETTDLTKAKEAAQKDEALLKTTIGLVCEADELFSDNVSLSDSRVQAIRRQVENAMPRVYEHAQDCTSSHTSLHTSSHTCLYMLTAESFLMRFPDASQNGVLRPHNSPPRKGHSATTGAGVSPSSNGRSPSTYSPPRGSLAQVATPAAFRLQSHAEVSGVAPPLSQPGPSTPSSSNPLSSGPLRSLHTPSPLLQYQSSGMQPFPVSQPNHSTTHPPPATPSPSAFAQPGSYPDTRLRNLPGTSWPLLWSPHYEARYAPSHLYDEVEHTTQNQKMVFCAVHDLLQRRSSRLTRQPWYEPPIGLSPEELVSGQDPRIDPWSYHAALGGQFQRYLRPTHPSPSAAGQPYHLYGNRSVAVGTGLPRSASMK